MPLVVIAVLYVFLARGNVGAVGIVGPRQAREIPGRSVSDETGVYRFACQAALDHFEDELH